MNTRKPLIIGHRGASHDAPENTLASFRLAFEQGADGIEADFRLTRDQQIVCMHDATTARTAGIVFSVEQSTLHELSLLDVGSWFGSRWTGEKIPTLAEVLAIVPSGKMIFIEVKCGAEIIPHLKEILNRSKIQTEMVRLLTFDTELAGELAKMIPGVGVCLNVEYVRGSSEEPWMPSRDQILEMIACSGAAGLSSEAHDTVDELFADALRRSGRELFIWTLDSIDAVKRFKRLGVDAVMTNRPGLLKAGMFSSP